MSIQEIKKEVIRELVELVPKVQKIVAEDNPQKNVELLNRLNNQIQAGNVKANAELAIMLLFTHKMEQNKGQ
jgi:hypothetical protein